MHKDKIVKRSADRQFPVIGASLFLQNKKALTHKSEHHNFWARITSGLTTDLPLLLIRSIEQFNMTINAEYNAIGWA